MKDKVMPISNTNYGGVSLYTLISITKTGIKAISFNEGIKAYG